VGESRFPLFVSGLAVLVVVVFRFFGGAGFGFLDLSSTSGMVPSGVVDNEHDNLMYLSWTEEARQGSWLFEDRYALEEHPRIFFNPYFLTIGHLSRWLGVAPRGLVVLSGLAAIPVIIVAGYWIGRWVGLSVTAARCAVVLIAFASGITFPLVFVWSAFGAVPSVVMGADRDYVDALFFHTFLVYPYITVAYALMCLTILVALSCDRDDLSMRARCGRLLLLGLMTLLLGFTHPYEHAMLLAGYSGFVLWTGLVPKTRPAMSRRLPVLAVMGVGSGLVVGYFFWLASHPVWNYVAKTSSHLPFDPIMWVLGYGILLPLAFLGAAQCVTKPAMERAHWLISWMALLILLLIILNIPQTKVSAGGHLPLCILGGVGLTYLAERVAAVAAGWRRALAWAGLAFVWLSLFGSTISFVIVKFGKDYRVDGDLMTLASRMTFHDHEPPRVACEVEAAYMLVPLCGVRVYCGNQYKTPEFVWKRDQQALAGFQPWKGIETIDPLLRRRTLVNLLREQKIDYLILNKSVAAMTDIDKIRGLDQVYAQGDWSLWRVGPSLSLADDS
jgi:hypothetical protein